MTLLSKHADRNSQKSSAVEDCKQHSTVSFVEHGSPRNLMVDKEATLSAEDSGQSGLTQTKKFIGKYIKINREKSKRQADSSSQGPTANPNDFEVSSENILETMSDDHQVMVKKQPATRNQSQCLPIAQSYINQHKN